MLEHDIFCCWKEEMRNGKKTKVPYNVKTGSRANSNDLSTFSSFEEAVQVMHNYAGIGFIVSHEAIIDEESWRIVQKIREGRRRPTKYGPMSVLSGMMFCAECGAKLYQVRSKRIPKHLEYFVCATYRKQKGMCSSHRIRNQVVEELLLEDLKRITA